MIDRFINFLLRPGHPLEHQMFLFGTIAVMLGLTSALCISLFALHAPLLTVVSALSLLVCIAAAVYSFRTHKYDIGNITYVIFAIYITFPLGILFGGGIYSGVPIWFVIAIVYIAMVFERRRFFIFMGIGLVLFVVTAYYSYMNPQLFQVEFTPFFRFLHISFSVVFLAILVALLVRYQQILFKNENNIAHKQKDEIQALSDAQSRFFSSMSHEIRTPLNTIIGLNEMTLRDQTISEEVADNAVNIQNASRMLLSLINDVLDLSTIESGRMELAEDQYETSQMLSDIVNLLWGRAKDKGLSFEVNVGEGVPSMLYGDEMRLKQVIINVLSNAIKYTEEGSVSLSVDGETVGANEFMLRIDIDDTGIGIRKEALPYLFDSFKRVDTERNRNVEGTGLGLAISKEIVDLMGGTILVDSIYTKGSHFQIEVKQKIANPKPMEYTLATGVSNPESYVNIFEAPDAHVLIVDDNDMNRIVTRKLLRSTRVQTDMAASGQECLEKTANTHYDLIFMDHEMPEMDGIETLKAVRSQSGGLCHNTPVIALTANAGSDRNAFYAAQGFQAYLAKPIHGSLLEATLLQFLPPDLVERSLIQNEEERIKINRMEKRRGIVVSVDSPCDLPEEMLEQYRLTRMPLYVVTEHGRFRDTEEIDSDNLFAYCATGARAYSEAGAVEEYEAFFGELLNEAASVIHVTISSSIGRSYKTALQAAASFDNVHVVDSHSISSGIGLTAIKASKLVEEGKNITEILEALDAYTDKVIANSLVTSHESPIVQTYMPAPIRALIQAFSLDPIMKVDRRGAGLGGFKGGYVSSASDKYIKSAMRRANRRGDKKLLFVVYAGCSVEEQENIRKAVEELSTFEELIMQKASATLAANTWLHSFGIIYADE